MEVVTVFVVLITLYVYTLAVVSTRVRTSRDHGSDELFFVLLVPTLNEELVIGETIASLLELRGDFLALIIDDASDDATVEMIAPFLDDHRIRLLEQPPELARRGKGHALNAGYAAVQRLRLAERYGPENLITVVFDADTRVEPDFLHAVAPYFRDPKVAGVQSAVRMYNANLNVLTLWQHLEFAIWAKFFCRAKDLLGSATLGGNGQCVRFAALNDLGEEPWQASSLTEDLDLSLRLLREGWRLRFCSSIAVWQEAVPRLRALARQRSRWLQGHVVCWQHLPALLRSRLPVFARLDLLLFLLLPVVFMPIGLVSILNYLLLFLKDWNGLNVVSLLIWYVLGFGVAPLVVAAWRPLDSPSLWRSLLHCHLFVFYAFVWFMAGVAAYWHVLLGRRAWVKTGHVAEVALEYGNSKLTDLGLVLAPDTAHSTSTGSGLAKDPADRPDAETVCEGLLRAEVVGAGARGTARATKAAGIADVETEKQALSRRGTPEATISGAPTPTFRGGSHQRNTLSAVVVVLSLLLAAGAGRGLVRHKRARGG